MNGAREVPLLSNGHGPDEVLSPVTPLSPTPTGAAGLSCKAERPPQAGSLFTNEDEDVGVDAEMGAEMTKLMSKMALVSPSDDVYELLLEHLRERVYGGMGETIYEIGIGEGELPGLNEEDMQASIATLKTMAATLNADCVELRFKSEKCGQVAEFLIRKRAESRDFMEVRIAVVGNVDAGKSTLLGVLTHGELDNGRGFARLKLFRHKHEMESGRTSSVGNDILGFDSSGQVVNKPDHGHLDWTKICEESSKVITFIDLAGHERYLKTTVFGMTGHTPDFSMLMIGANAGIVGMTKEHLGLALALSVPVFVVVTKIDMCPPNVLQDTLKLLQRVLKSPGCRKIPVLVQTEDDVITSAVNFSSERICPIFQVSNVTGENLQLLRMFLNLLAPRIHFNEHEPAEFQIDDTFSVPGVGTVVSGTTLKGVIRLNDTMLLGPDSLGEFIPVPVKSIHRKRMPVKEVRGGQTASFALKKIKRSYIRKGMVMVSPALNPTACWEFESEVLVLHHPTTISCKYQAMVHVGSVRQTASIISMSTEHLRTGDKASVKFRFIKNPEYLRQNMRMVFREGRTKAVGTIVKLYPYVSAVAQNMRSSRAQKKAMESGHHMRPQNEPQKPSKRNRKSRHRGTELSGAASVPSAASAEPAASGSGSTGAPDPGSANTGVTTVAAGHVTGAEAAAGTQKSTIT
ncbi:GTP-binding protein 1 isoform X2 [Lingula anatina]|uniref:GTP-binding protein 1 n=1 Tax=Lingula anatina TaxID=7574 RepID=A0A1S3K518_LINAN|nr:GTP-binding protein 1 isoform X2 [Lingula anatina]|eukprot:XP_013417602.1 GTP-binding protein 1 isoform X2 [Lingula anatina]